MYLLVVKKVQICPFKGTVPGTRSGSSASTLDGGHV